MGSCYRVTIDERHVPFEFVGKIASSSSMAKAGDIEGGARPRHDIGVCQKCVSVEQVSSVLLGGTKEKGLK